MPALRPDRTLQGVPLGFNSPNPLAVAVTTLTLPAQQTQGRTQTHTHTGCIDQRRVCVCVWMYVCVCACVVCRGWQCQQNPSQSYARLDTQWWWLMSPLHCLSLLLLSPLSLLVTLPPLSSSVCVSLLHSNTFAPSHTWTPFPFPSFISCLFLRSLTHAVVCFSLFVFPCLFFLVAPVASRQFPL